MGSATIKYVGHARVSSAGLANGITVAGMAGASFSTILLAPKPKFSDIAILYQTPPETYLATTPPGPNTSGYSTLNVLPILTTPYWGAGGSPGRAVFTQDGRVIYSLSNGMTTELFISYMDGSGLTQLTKTSISHLNPSVSVSNKLILFDDGNGNIYTMPLSVNGAETKVPITGPASQGAMSPDGTKIAYVQAKGQGGNGALRIAPYPAGGAGTTLLAVNATYTGFNTPCWSPDGLKIATVAVLPPVAGAGSTGIITLNVALGAGTGLLEGMESGISSSWVCLIRP